jgi:hypothetical protein
MKPTSQDNAAGIGNDGAADEPSHDTAEPGGASNRSDGLGDGRSAKEPVSPLPSEEAGEEPPSGAEATEHDSAVEQEDDAGDGRSGEAEVNTPPSPEADGDGPEPTPEALDRGSSPGGLHELGPAEETATASPNAGHSSGERGSKTKKRKERQPELFDEASRHDLPRPGQTGEDTETVDEDPNAAHEVTTSTDEATGENYAPPDAAAEQTAAAQQNRDAQVAASDLAIQSDTVTDAEPGDGYPYMLFVEMLYPPPDGDINKYPPADWAQIQLSIRELRGAIDRCGHLARLFAVPR